MWPRTLPACSGSTRSPGWSSRLPTGSSSPWSSNRRETATRPSRLESLRSTIEGNRRSRRADSHQVLISIARYRVIVPLWAAGPAEEVAMQILIVNFNLDGLTEEEFASSCDELAPVFAAVPGL